MIEERNAKIRSTHLGCEDHGIMTVWINLEWEGGGQGFGGYALDQWEAARNKRIGTAYGMQFIMAILDTLEVERWEKLVGTVVRIRAEYTKVHAIGHFLKDQWFDPAELLIEMKPYDV